MSKQEKRDLSTALFIFTVALIGLLISAAYVNAVMNQHLEYHPYTPTTHSVYQESVNPQTPLTTNYYQGR